MKHRRRHARWPWRLRAGIEMAACLVAIAATWFVALTMARLDEADAVRAIERTNRNLALALEEMARSTFQSVDQAVRFLRYAWVTQGRSLDVESLVRSGDVDVSNVAQLRVLDANGDPVAIWKQAGRVNVADREYFRLHRDPDPADKPRVSPPVVSRASGIPSIQVTRRITDAHGGFAGVVAASIPVELATRFYDRVSLGPHDVLSLISIDGMTLARRVGNVTNFGQDVGGSVLIQQQRRKPSGAYVGPGYLDHVTKQFTYRTLPEFGVIVVVGTAMEDALAPVRRRQQLYVATAGGASVLLFGLLWLILAASRHQEIHMRELAKREKRFRDVFDRASDAIFVLDVSAEGATTWVDANPAARRLAGLPEPGGALPANGATDRLGPELVEAIAAGVARAEPRAFNRVATIGGRALWLSGSIQPVSAAGERCTRAIAILADRTAEQEAAERLRGASRSLQALTHRMVHLEEAGRRALARELHDQVGHLLAALGTHLQRAQASVGRATAIEAAELATCSKLLLEIGSTVRGMISELRPAVLDDFGLLAALRSHAEQFERRTGTRLHFKQHGGDRRPPPEVETVIYRVAQEVLENVARHAKARNVTVLLRLAPDRATLLVGDDGAGFDPAAAPAPGRWGLRMLGERVASIGGRIRLRSTPGKGTCVIVRWRKPAPGEESALPG